MALSVATTPGQSGPGSYGNGGVFRIPQSSSTAGTSPSDCLVSYPGHSLGGSYLSAERSSRCILQPHTKKKKRKKKEYPMPTCLTLSIIRYSSRVSGVIQRKA